MEEKDQIPQEFDLEDILKEFGGEAPAEGAGLSAEEILPSGEDAQAHPGEEALVEEVPVPAQENSGERETGEEQPEEPEQEAEPAEEAEVSEESTEKKPAGKGGRRDGSSFE